jgi:hypothetical protein
VLTAQSLPLPHVPIAAEGFPGKTAPIGAVFHYPHKKYLPPYDPYHTAASANLEDERILPPPALRAVEFN